MKKLQHEENMESERNMETRNKCNAKKVRPEESIETEQNLEKKSKRRVHYSAQTDNGPLYTGSILRDSNYTML